MDEDKRDVLLVIYSLLLALLYLVMIFSGFFLSYEMRRHGYPVQYRESAVAFSPIFGLLFGEWGKSRRPLFILGSAIGMVIGIFMTRIYILDGYSHCTISLVIITANTVFQLLITLFACLPPIHDFLVYEELPRWYDPFAIILTRFFPGV